MADGDVAGHAEGAGSGRNLFDLEHSERAGVVKMDIDIHAAPLRNTEHDVEMPFDIAVEIGRVDAADQIGAHRNGFIEQFRRCRDYADMPFCGKATSWMSMKSA